MDVAVHLPVLLFTLRSHSQLPLLLCLPPYPSLAHFVTRLLYPRAFFSFVFRFSFLFLLIIFSHAHNPNLVTHYLHARLQSLPASLRCTSGHPPSPYNILLSPLYSPHHRISRSATSTALLLYYTPSYHSTLYAFHYQVQLNLDLAVPSPPFSFYLRLRPIFSFVMIDSTNEYGCCVGVGLSIQRF
ncbi:hypothetical protein BOTBODRAFT_532313 [Botryobasidium botryosum FD-172 SS1]|uniref:Uncharacterized protein n=1 Tax=Botryobasidium botryosum (strain FD-172 SS1) TaxID=930990 RepID=A0A067M161_BOTB1|nr:hypothetical protein BOTBODRAFT_532313 [Botryobasidium botryosum FD-172 SS1]